MIRITKMDKTVKKTGIMGGTFNPIHNGHLYLAENAFIKGGLDDILWIPNCIAYLKNNGELIPPDIRWEMTSLATKDIAHYSMSDIEIKRGGNSYTYETLSALRELYSDTEFYFITGADTLYTIEKWVKPELVFSQAKILAAYRSGQSHEDFNDQISHLQEKYNADITLISSEPVDVSSTQIRQLIREGQDASDYLPAPVYEYILKNNIYR